MKKEKWYKKWYISFASTVLIFVILDQWVTDRVILYFVVGILGFITIFAILAHFHNKKK